MPMLRHRTMRDVVRPLWLTTLLIGTLGAGCGGGGGSSSVSPASLKSQLLPPSQLRPLKLERSFQWDNPTDFIVQGTVLPAQTAPTAAIAAMSGFQAAAGDSLVPPGGGPPIPVDVAAFDSSD